MSAKNPETELDSRFSSSNATATAWAAAREQLAQAEIYWLSTVRPDGRPHVTPLIAVWLDEALYFSTGAHERKAKNLAHNTQCILTTGCNAMAAGLDVVVEGEAVQISDEAKLQRVANTYNAKYDQPFNYTVHDGAFAGIGGTIARVFEVKPTVAFGYGRGDSFSQTRWRF